MCASVMLKKCNFTLSMKMFVSEKSRIWIADVYLRNILQKTLTHSFNRALKRQQPLTYSQKLLQSIYGCGFFFGDFFPYSVCKTIVSVLGTILLLHHMHTICCALVVFPPSNVTDTVFSTYVSHSSCFLTA